MPLLTILDTKQAKRFDLPPSFTAQERLINFHLPPDLKRSISNMGGDINKVCLVLQYGYFKANARFYNPAKFRKRDIKYVCNLLGCEMVQMEDYNSTTNSRHRLRILKARGWEPFGESHRSLVVDYAHKQASNQLDPRKLFMALVDLCWDRQITVPGYDALATIVTDAYNSAEESVIQALSCALNDTQRDNLDKLLDQGKKVGSRHQPPITSLKKVEQSIRPGKLVEAIRAAQIFQSAYITHEPVYERITLSDQATRYYADWLSKADYQQIMQFPSRDKVYLHLLAFIKDQYFRRQDALVKAFLKVVTASLHSIQSKVRDQDEANKKERMEALQTLNQSHKSYMAFAKAVINIVESKETGPNEKYYRIEELVHEFGGVSLEDQDRLGNLDEYLSKESRNQSFYDLMEKEAIKLERRALNIVRFLEYDTSTSDPDLIKAIDYVLKDPNAILEDAPTEFLKSNEQNVIQRDDQIVPALYKSLLFFHMAKAIKGGRLNLKHSYEYRAIQNYLLDLRYWEENRDRILKETGLDRFKDGRSYLELLKAAIHSKYESVNERILNQENPYFTVNRHGQPSIRTPSVESQDREYISDTLSSSGYVPILDVLREINAATGFTDSLKHHSNKNVKMKPEEDVFLAGIIGKGCNIGIGKLSKISTGIKEHLLHNTVNWCFSLKNLHDANNTLVEAICKLALANNFLTKPAVLHSSSDGRKVNVSVDALHANYSYKYFGKGQGVTLYTFIDERQAIFHSTVFSASDREAAYVLDGLMHNSVQPNQIHSTDTHGYTEKIFGASHMLGVDFAPRLKDLSRQRIYAFSARKTFQKKGYALIPTRPINKNLILKNWDDILRFMATIKTHHATASQLFKRLSSYSNQHPLYEALQEFGRIIKTQFILTYFDDVTLRQQIQKQLNRIELSNKFSHAVFFDNDQEFQDGEPEDQQLSAACQVIIQNSIILWNYLFLSKLIMETEDKEQRQQIIDCISHGSVITWKHVNLRGEYNFTRKAANEAQFDYKKIRSWRF